MKRVVSWQLGWQLVLGAVSLGALVAAGGSSVERFEPTRVASVEHVAAIVPRSQTPQPPFPYVVEPFALTAPDGVSLAGSLTRPRDAGPHPAVVLVSGAGDQDRDGTIAGHKPFLVLADHLGRAGFAVLRLDDRGVGASGGHGEEATVRVRAGDIAAAFTRLRARADVRADAVGLVGHSEGSTVAAKVAGEHEVAFVVSLAGPGLPGAELSPLQVRSVLRATGDYPQPVVERLVAAQRQILEVVVAGGDRAAITAAVRTGIATLDALQPAAHRESDAALTARAERDGRLVASPWYRDFVATDPRPLWRRVRCPVLAVAGARDTQVPATPNLEVLAAAVAAGGNRRVVTRRYPELNHLLQVANTGLVQEYAGIPHTLDPRVLRELTAWLREHTAPSPRW